MMKWNKYILIYLSISLAILFLGFLFLYFGKGSYSAKVPIEDACTKEAVIEMSKMIYVEFGPDVADNSDENFYARLATAAVILNNANVNHDTFTKGTTMADRLYNLSDNKYASHSSYKNKSLDEVVKTNKNQIIYISQLVLTGKFNFPSNMIFQASKDIVERWGYAWDVVYTHNGFVDTYFGYEYSLNNTDIWGRTINNTSTDYYRNLAISLELSDYSAYTIDNVCRNDSTNDDVNQKHNVYFYMNDGSNTIYQNLDVENGSTVTLPTPPSLENYVFIEWHYGDGSKFDSSVPITEDTYLYALWERENNPGTSPTPDSDVKQYYNVYFYMNDGSNTIYQTLDVENGSTVTLPTPPSLENYVFIEWHYGDGSKFDSSIPIDEDTYLYALWEEKNNSDSGQQPNYSEEDNSNNESNPQTSDRLYLILIIMFLSLIVSLYIYRGKLNNIDN